MHERDTMALTKREDFLALCKPMIGDEEVTAVVDILKSGWLTTGKAVKDFEQGVCDYTGAKHALGLMSCTGGLHMALAAHGVGPGDEVIVPTYTFVATAHVVTWLGATPVLVDSDPQTFNIDPAAIQKAITPKTKAIIPVHIAGNPCDMDAIMALAKQHKLVVIEDAAHALGTTYKGRKIGAIGDVTAFSFYAIKNMTTGEGGMLTTDDEALMTKLRRLAYFGVNKDAYDRYGKGGSWYYQVEGQGYKYNMDNIQGAMGVEQLKKLDTFNAKRTELAAAYTKRFSEIKGIRLQEIQEGGESCWHLFTIVIDEDTLGITRADLIDKLKEYNIGTSVHFIPLHLHPFYQEQYGYKEGDFPGAESVYKGLITLPLYPGMEEKDVEYVVEAIKEIIGV